MRARVDDYYNSDFFFVGDINIQALELYVTRRIEPGQFLRCILEGDLYRAVQYSDISNQQRIFHIVKYITKTLPEACFGSKEKVQVWLRKI